MRCSLVNLVSEGRKAYEKDRLEDERVDRPHRIDYGALKDSGVSLRALVGYPTLEGPREKAEWVRHLKHLYTSITM